MSKATLLQSLQAKRQEPEGMTPQPAQVLRMFFKHESETTGPLFYVVPSDKPGMFGKMERYVPYATHEKGLTQWFSRGEAKRIAKSLGVILEEF